MRGEDLEEVEIDLRDSSETDEFDNGDEPQMLWRAPPAPEEEENIHTSALVEISDTKPLINVRDPRGINDCLKVLHFLTQQLYQTLFFWLFVHLSHAHENQKTDSTALQWISLIFF